MPTPFRAIALVTAFLTAATTAVAAEPSGRSLTPEEVARLYLKTFVNDDAVAGQALNTYLKPAFEGKDAFNMAVIGKLHQLNREHWESNLPRLVNESPLKADPEDVKVALNNLFVANQWQHKQAQCDVAKARIKPNEPARAMSSRGSKADIAEIRFSCRIPAASPARMADLERTSNANDGAGFRRASQAYLDEIKAGQLTKTVSGETMLYHGRTKDARWWTGGNDAWTDPLGMEMPK